MTRPIDGNDRVASGIGDFGNIGAGGFGGGFRGTRSSQGNTVNNALETSVNSLRYLNTPLVMHEFGHATGLPHARDVQALMSYVGSTQYLPVGSGYAFRGTIRVAHKTRYMTFATIWTGLSNRGRKFTSRSSRIDTTRPIWPRSFGKCRSIKTGGGLRDWAATV